jgi:hypothetical protein
LSDWASVSVAIEKQRVHWCELLRLGAGFGYAKFSPSHYTVIRVYDHAGNVIETHDHTGDFKEP